MNKAQEKIIDAYIGYVSERGKRPFTIRRFAEYCDLDESEVGEHFNSVRQIARSFWTHVFASVTGQLTQDEQYASYSIREKMLAFYFTWIEYIKSYKTYLEVIFRRAHLWQVWPDEWDPMKVQFEKFIKEIIEEGKISGEVADRMLVTDHYHRAIWMQFVFVHRFWLRDNSAGSEDTDAAIEKAVNFGMDLMERNTIDSFLDLSKFVAQKW